MSKGSAPRPFEVDHQTFSDNFDAIFGKKCPVCDSKPCKCETKEEDKMNNEIESLKTRLKEATTKVPYAVQNGSIQLTREWMKNQKNAVKLLGKNIPQKPSFYQQSIR